MTPAAEAKHIQIAQTLRQRIARGDLPPGRRLPPESVLVREFSAARGTVRQALLELESEGLVISHPGRGRWVSNGAVSPVDQDARYQLVAADVRTAIREGRFKPGARLPAEQALAQHYGVARITIRRALETLEGEGLVGAVARRGHFVRAGTGEPVAGEPG
jgi:DNA-binding GntR family transcriptional regulator